MVDNKIANWSHLKEVLRRHNFSFRKSLGQNFLIDKNILDKIVDAAGVSDDCAVLEIGAGAGVLTFQMGQAAKKVVTIEIDRSLIPVLEENLSGLDNITIIANDILKVDIDELFEEHFKNCKVKVVANLPYYITTPIIMKFLEGTAHVESLTVMVQKEVAQRMCAKAGSKDYGALTVAVAYHTKASIVLEASPHSFMPQPAVSSMVVNLEVLPNKSVCVNNEQLFFNIVKAAFGQRRKTLINAISNSIQLDFEKTQIADVIEKMGLRPDVRGETLDVEQFAQLTNLLEGHNVYRQ